MKTIKLVREGTYKLPLSGQVLTEGMSASVTDMEWKRVSGSGRFIDATASDLVSQGLIAVSEDPDLDVHLPADWTGKKMVVKMVGGIGDSIICTSVCRALKRKSCVVTFAAQDKQLPLLGAFASVDHTISATKLNRPEVQKHYDVLLNMNHAVTTPEVKIVDKDYYAAVYAKAGLPLPINRDFMVFQKNMMFEARKHLPAGRLVAIHTGSSNPLRRWGDTKYHELANRLIQKHGCAILWMGYGDYAFDGPKSIVASNLSADLLDQAAMLASCNYFIGNDSAFAHLAGTLNIPGNIIFSATEPNHVIGQYPSLKPVEAFQNGRRPSRTLRNDDPYAVDCMRRISVDRVMNAVPDNLFGNISVDTTPRKRVKAQQAPRQVETSDADVTRVPIGRQNRVLWVLPHMIVGGGEIVTLSLIKQLKQWMPIDIVGLHETGEGDRFDAMKDAFEQEADNFYSFEGPEQHANVANLVGGGAYDLVMFYGWENHLLTNLNALQIRPPIIRVCHTESEKEFNLIRGSRKLHDGLVCVSPNSARILGDSDFIPNGVDVVRFRGQAPAKLKFTNDKTVLGYIGRFDHGKGIYHLLDQMAEHDFNLIAVGPQDHKEARWFQERVKKDKLTDRVHIVDSTTNVEPYYLAMDAYVLLSAREGMPLGPLEAAYCGVPSISTAVGALPTLFDDRTSIIFTEIDGSTFAEALTVLKNEGQAIGQTAKDIVQANYTDSTQAVMYRKYMRRIMGQTWPKAIQEGSICVERRPGAGDVLMALSTVRKIKEMLPECTVTFDTKEPFVPLAMRCTDVDAAAVATEDMEFDHRVKMDYYDCWKEKQHAAEAMGGSITEIADSIDIYEDSINAIRRHIPGDAPSVGVWMYQSNVSAKTVKEWPEESWVELATKLRDSGITVCQLGAPFEKHVDGLVDLRQHAIVDSVASLAAVDIVVCIDCVAQHACKALGLPAIVLWGGAGESWLTGYESHVNIKTEDDRRCFASVCISTLVPDCCGDADCMHGIKVESVHNAIITQLRNDGKI